jgi:ParB family transcriptional regulator, chromosome partitioning protein
MAEGKKKAAKKTAKKEGAAKKTTRRKAPAAEAASRGLTAAEVAEGSDVSALARAIEADGGTVLASYREPLGGHATVLAALPIEKVEPTPFQRDLSPAHVGRLTEVIDKLGRFLDPVVAVPREGGGAYLTPNGNHRLHAMKALGAKAIVALVVPEARVAYQILALNTEKAHNVREKAMETIRMARSLAPLSADPESKYAFEFEEPLLLTLGACYETRGRFSGGAYAPVLRRIEGFLDVPLTEALEVRAARAERLFALDDAVTNAIAVLKDKGLQSPYLRAFVVARCNPLRFSRGTTADWDETIEKMTSKARGFDAGEVDAAALANASGPPEEG